LNAGRYAQAGCRSDAPVRRVETQRLLLEPVTTVNAAVLWRVMQGPHLREFQDVPRFTRDEFARRVAARPRRFDARLVGRFEWLLILQDTKQAIGWVSLRVGDQSRGAAEIGYSILAPYRNSGYASEAAQAIVDVAFEESALRQVDACCVPTNLASRRLLAKIGFNEARLQRNGAIVRGRPVDIAIFEIGRERWEALRSERRARTGTAATRI